MRRWAILAILQISGAAMAQDPVIEPAEAAPDPAPRQSRFSTVDRLELETTSIANSRR